MVGGGGAAGGEGVKAASLSPRYLGGGGAGGGAVRPSGSPRPASVEDADPRTYIVKAPPHEPNGSGGGGIDDALSSGKTYYGLIYNFQDKKSNAKKMYSTYVDAASGAAVEDALHRSEARDHRRQWMLKTQRSSWTPNSGFAVLLGCLLDKHEKLC